MTKKKEFSIQSAMQVVMRHKKPIPQKPMHLHDHGKIIITEDVIKDCMVSVARFIERDGDVYLPIFKRLNKELKLLREKNKLKEFVQKVANDNVDF